MTTGILKKWKHQDNNNNKHNTFILPPERRNSFRKFEISVSFHSLPQQLLQLCVPSLSAESTSFCTFAVICISCMQKQSDCLALLETTQRQVLKKWTFSNDMYGTLFVRDGKVRRENVASSFRLETIPHPPRLPKDSSTQQNVTINLSPFSNCFLFTLWLNF